MSLADLAARAAAAWGAVAVPRLISHRENAVFEAQLPGGQRAALRLHRKGYRTEAEILSELQWCAALERAGLGTPRPLATRNGGLIVDLGQGHLATAIAWIEGAPIGAGGTPLCASLAERTEVCRALGAALGRLHKASDAMELLPGFVRPVWDRAALVGPDPLWGRFWDHPSLSSAEATRIVDARDRAAQVLKAQDGLDFGLIHADALRENVYRRTDGALVLIDFDDSGTGYRLYDLAVAISQSLEDVDYADQRAALLAGYREKRVLGAQDAALLPLFAMLRAFASLGWTVPRLAADDPAVAPYRRRALLAADRFMSDLAAD